MFTMKRAIKFAIFLSFLDISSSEQNVLGDVKRDDGNILWIYYTLNAIKDTMDWVSVCYTPKITKSVADVVCHQRGFVGALNIGYGSWKSRSNYSFNHIECPTVSDYTKYGESHILRCSLEGPIQTPNGCEPVTVECNPDLLTDNPYEGQVTMKYAETGTLSDGIVKVFFKGKWAGICYNDNFLPNVADSVCRQRGYTGYSSIKPEADNDNDKKALVFSNYHCVQSSFACFSHCIAESSYHFEACQHQILIHCKFNSSVMLLQSSGSSSQCALTSTNTNTCNNKFETATWVRFSVLVVLILMLIFVSVFICLCISRRYFKKKQQYRRGLLANCDATNATNNDQEALNDE